MIAHWHWTLGKLLIACVLGATLLQQAIPALAQSDDYQQMVDRGVGYLLNQGQAQDGSFSKQAGPGVTAIVTASLLKQGRTPADPGVAKSLTFLESFVQPNGGIYMEGSNFQNYETCLAIVCFSLANHEGQYDKLLADAEKYVRRMQIDGDEQKTAEDVEYGGAGYGAENPRPDLSNTSFLMDALQSVGADADDEAVQRALIFVSRCQNLESEHNTTPSAALVNDGGFYYTPAGGGSSPAGKTANGGLRSYGLMTYAGLKSMIFAGLKPDDPRVAAANQWIRDHYDLKNNPGMGEAGLYYYYHVFAKALDATGMQTIEDSKQQSHDWRAELIAELASRQREDGSWVNENRQWLEGDPNLVTAYALLSLSYCRDREPK